jgi:hypothetical protein
MTVSCLHGVRPKFAFASLTKTQLSDVTSVAGCSYTQSLDRDDRVSARTAVTSGTLGRETGSAIRTADPLRGSGPVTRISSVQDNT